MVMDTSSQALRNDCHLNVKRLSAKLISSPGMANPVLGGGLWSRRLSSLESNDLDVTPSCARFLTGNSKAKEVTRTVHLEAGSVSASFYRDAHKPENTQLGSLAHYREEVSSYNSPSRTFGAWPALNLYWGAVPAGKDSCFLLGINEFLFYSLHGNLTPSYIPTPCMSLADVQKRLIDIHKVREIDEGSQCLDNLVDVIGDSTQKVPPSFNIEDFIIPSEVKTLLNELPDWNVSSKGQVASSTSSDEAMSNMKGSQTPVNKEQRDLCRCSDADAVAMAIGPPPQEEQIAEITSSGSHLFSSDESNELNKAASPEPLCEALLKSTMEPDESTQLVDLRLTCTQADYAHKSPSDYVAKQLRNQIEDEEPFLTSAPLKPITRSSLAGSDKTPVNVRRIKRLTNFPECYVKLIRFDIDAVIAQQNLRLNRDNEVQSSPDDEQEEVRAVGKSSRKGKVVEKGRKKRRAETASSDWEEEEIVAVKKSRRKGKADTTKYDEEMEEEEDEEETDTDYNPEEEEEKEEEEVVRTNPRKGKMVVQKSAKKGKAETKKYDVNVLFSSKKDKEKTRDNRGRKKRKLFQEGMLMEVEGNKEESYTCLKNARRKRVDKSQEKAEKNQDVNESEEDIFTEKPKDKNKNGAQPSVASSSKEVSIADQHSRARKSLEKPKAKKDNVAETSTAVEPSSEAVSIIEKDLQGKKRKSMTKSKTKKNKVSKLAACSSSEEVSDIEKDQASESLIEGKGPPTNVPQKNQMSLLSSPESSRAVSTIEKNPQASETSMQGENIGYNSSKDFFKGKSAKANENKNVAEITIVVEPSSKAVSIIKKDLQASKSLQAKKRKSMTKSKTKKNNVMKPLIDASSSSEEISVVEKDQASESLVEGKGPPTNVPQKNQMTFSSSPSTEFYDAIVNHSTPVASGSLNRQSPHMFTPSLPPYQVPQHEASQESSDLQEVIVISPEMRDISAQLVESFAANLLGPSYESEITLSEKTQSALWDWWKAS
ncbi:hypothetical protein CAPTEDRAFT_185979 [Capitella teleta]|uniref:Uncharacterized protein n=1 Tax=Capitella teleta TaxID=283909 RepID=R7TQH9_CAPTE|nr:hypothetical protein CAPTEDRAFT_185979 [Capitella teleta]|eukprot:ELT96183.1 hypothetical protein CAPTEDRAFT_185979 [Capitella teleta]